MCYNSAGCGRPQKPVFSAISPIWKFFACKVGLHIAASIPENDQAKYASRDRKPYDFFLIESEATATFSIFPKTLIAA